MGCDTSHTGGEDAAIVFDASFPDTGTDAGPPPSNVGTSCASDTDCAAGPATMCLTQLDGGYCTRDCTADGVCPHGSSCTAIPRSETSLCLVSCTIGEANQCRENYGCTNALGPPVCLPGCEEGDCPEGLSCGPGGDWNAGACYDPSSQLGDACTADTDCPAGGECFPDADEWPDGTCVVWGCDPTGNTGCAGDGQCFDGGFEGGYCLDGCSDNTDCRTGYVCRADIAFPTRLACQPEFIPGNLGQACATTGSCQGGACLSETFNGYPGSYCVSEACDPDATTPCPGDGVCIVPTGYTLGYCYDGCTSVTDCRQSYDCLPSDSANPSSPTACLPACDADSDCTAVSRGGTPYVCNQGTGRCVYPIDASEIGGACTGTSFFECRGGRCMDEATTGWSAGTCTLGGCALPGRVGASEPCPTGTVCTNDGTGDPTLGVCVDACTVGTTTCRDGYTCFPLTEGGTEGACRPACTSTSCTQATCNVGGLCGISGPT